MSLPLSGKKVLVTRAAEQAIDFSQLLKEAGAIPIVVPLLTIKPTFTKENNKVLQKLHDYTWVFFTSANGVKFFFNYIEQLGISKVLLQSIKMATVGKKTANMLRAYGYEADFYPEQFHGKQMVAEFLQYYANTERVLLVCGNRSREEIPLALTEQQVFFQKIVLYDTLVNEKHKALLHNYVEDDSIDVFTFTSPSTIEAFDKMTDNSANKDVIKHRKLCLCIGSTTREIAIKSGFTHILTPNQYTIEGMIEELKRYYKSKGTGEET